MMGTCQGCGASFTIRTRGKDANKYCSKQCTGRKRGPPNWMHWWYVDCVVCKARVIQFKRDVRYPVCSLECGRALDHHRPSRSCPDCGREIEQPGLHRCETCRLAKLNGVYRRNKSIKRAKQYGCIYARVTSRMVIAKHGLTCWICGLSIDPSEAKGTASAFSMDHVVPLSLGGWHDLPNIRPAHHSCNASKSNRFSGQLMLAGVGGSR